MKKQFDFQIEALRGFCALVVLIHHSLYYSSLLSQGFDIRTITGGYTFPGHLMVLVFFMLSGYVIGLSYYGKPNFKIGSYLKKRVVRLYPIYFITVLVTGLLFKENLKVTIGSLFFLQNLASNNLDHDVPTWTLNHEFIYYLLAIPILKFKVRLKFVFIIMISLLAISLFIFPSPRIIEGYLVGFLFWLTGYKMSLIKKSKEISGHTIDFNRFLSLLFFLLACDTLSGFKLLLNHITVEHGTAFFNLSHMVEFNDFSVYPYCLFAIVIAVFPNSKNITIFSYLILSSCWLTITYWAIDGTLYRQRFFYIPLIFLVLSSVIFLIKKPIFSSYALLAKAGSISYAIYLIHTPILELLARVSIQDSTFISLCIKVLLLFFSTLVISYFLEMKLQPKIKQLIG